ncbi:medium-chain acyl-CoA ligase ACSF2, mitochondrial-like [Phlebotomus papatasi]|nr:medium-chain acyl-CoA ligase ACSF2, mitochondrial-like [Phlebotomus papatasi]
MEVVIRSVRILSRAQKIPKVIRWCHTKSSGLSYIHNVGKYPLVYRTIGQELSRVASEFGDREAYVCVEEGKRFTYGQLKMEADRLAAGFQAIGLARGDRLGIWAPNVAMWPVVMFAAARAGLILVALNPAYEAPEMEYCMQKVGIKALVTSETFRNRHYYEKLLQIVPDLDKFSPGQIHNKKLPFLQSVIINSEKNFPGALRLSDVESLATASQMTQIEDQQKSISPDSGCNIQFTSGTTGMPKAALLKHFGFVNNGMHIGNRNELHNKKLCMQVPFFHAYGTVITVMASLSTQATIVLPSIVYNPDKSLLAIRNEECQVIYGTPTMYVDLVNKQREKRWDLKAEIAVTGGALCSPQLLKDMKKELKLKKVKTIFGMTENSAVSFHTLPDDTDEQVLESVGHVQDNIEAKVIDNEGNLVPFGVPGELCVRGYFTMLGYWDDEEKTRETLGKDGWLRTGDQFVLQADGYGKIVGRLKEMIIRGGENIFPKEIENFLATCPQIAEAHIVGVPDERLGEELCAFVRLRAESGSFTENDIKDFCKGKISFHKIPRYIEIVTDFPKTLSGKIQKFKLQQQFEEKFSKK